MAATDVNRARKSLTHGLTFEDDKSKTSLSVGLRLLTLHPRSGWTKMKDGKPNYPFFVMYYFGIALTAASLVASTIMIHAIYSADMQCAKSPTLTETCVELWLYGVDEDVLRGGSASATSISLSISSSDAEEARWAIHMLIVSAFGYFVLFVARFLLPIMTKVSVLKKVAAVFGFFSKEGDDSTFNLETEGGMGTYAAFWIMFVITALNWVAFGMLHSIKLEDTDQITYTDHTGFHYLNALAGLTIYPLLRFAVSLAIQSDNPRFKNIRSQHEEQEELTPFNPSVSLHKNASLGHFL